MVKEDAVIGTSSKQSPNAHKMLSISNRSLSLRQEIDKAFELVKKEEASNWLYNGDDASYRLFNRINEYDFVKNLILQANKSDQREFIFVDLGAGNFKLSESICQQLEQDPDLPEQLMVHFVSVRGESTYKSLFTDPNYQTKRGTKTLQYHLYGFHLENLVEAFAKIQERHPHFPELLSRVDFMVSSMTFLHLVDPLGTLVQAYDLLAPQGGTFILDGFACPFGTDKSLPELIDTKHTLQPQGNLYQLLLASNALFLASPRAMVQDFHQFMIKRTSDEPLRLPVQYAKTIHDNDSIRGSNHHHSLVSYLPSKLTLLSRQEKPRGFQLFGDEVLFRSLQDLNLLSPEIVHREFADAFSLEPRDYKVEQNEIAIPQEQLLARSTQVQQLMMNFISLSSEKAPLFALLVGVTVALTLQAQGLSQEQVVALGIVSTSVAFCASCFFARKESDEKSLQKMEESQEFQYWPSVS